MKINHKDDYRQRRAWEYPALEDQIDAIMKGGEEFEKMRRQVLAIKKKYPKFERKLIKEVN